MKEITYWGLWWLPEKSETKIAGILTFSNQNGIELDLIGALPDSQFISEGFFTASDFHRDFSIILGVSREGKHITLYDCRSIHQQIGKFRSQRFRANILFIGAHFENVNKLKFNKISVQYSYLLDWASLSGITTAIKFYNKKIIEQYDIKYSYPEELKVSLSDAQISLKGAFTTKTHFRRRVELAETIQIEIMKKRSLSIKDWSYKYIQPIQNLLTLATTKPNALTEILAYSKNYLIKLPDGDTIESPIQIYYRTNYTEQGVSFNLLESDMIFTLKDIEFDLGGILGKWFKISNNLNIILNTFFSVQYSPTMYLQNQFLNIIQAIEGYHRGALNADDSPKFSNEAIPNSQYKNIKKIILQNSPKEYKEIIAGKLQFNEPSLRARVKDLIEKIDNLTSLFINDKEKYSKRVAEIRNNLAHLTSSQENKLDLDVLYWLTKSLIYILQANLLVDLGITQSKCVELYLRNQEFVFAKDKLKEFIR